MGLSLSLYLSLSLSLSRFLSLFIYILKYIYIYTYIYIYVYTFPRTAPTLRRESPCRCGVPRSMRGGSGGRTGLPNPRRLLGPRGGCRRLGKSWRLGIEHQRVGLGNRNPGLGVRE